jgi:hypothetical protein
MIGDCGTLIAEVTTTSSLRSASESIALSIAREPAAR